MIQNQADETIAKARRISRRLKPSRKFQPLRADALAPDSRCVKGLYSVWSNDLYTVTCRHFAAGWPLDGGEYILLGIHCEDGEPRHDWRDFQAIKNQLCGPEWEAVELFPAESRLLDPSNYYMLWCAPKIPIGKFRGRNIMDPENCIAPQRGWAKS